MPDLPHGHARFTEGLEDMSALPHGHAKFTGELEGM